LGLFEPGQQFPAALGVRDPNVEVDEEPGREVNLGAGNGRTVLGVDDPARDLRPGAREDPESLDGGLGRLERLG